MPAHHEPTPKKLAETNTKTTNQSLQLSARSPTKTGKNGNPPEKPPDTIRSKRRNRAPRHQPPDNTNHYRQKISSAYQLRRSHYHHQHRHPLGALLMFATYPGGDTPSGFIAPGGDVVRVAMFHYPHPPARFPQVTHMVIHRLWTNWGYAEATPLLYLYYVVWICVVFGLGCL